MKIQITILLLIPLLGLSQNQPTLNSEKETIHISQTSINDLVNKYKKILQNKNGIDGWRLQIKFTSKREDILPYQVKFTNLYPEIPVQIIFESPYYKLTAGNFKTKNEALKIKHKISNNFPGAHPVATIIAVNLFKK